MQINHKIDEIYFNVARAMKSRKDQSLLKVFYDEVKRVMTIYDSLLASMVPKETPKEEEPEVNEEPTITEAMPEETTIEE